MVPLRVPVRRIAVELGKTESPVQMMCRRLGLTLSKAENGHVRGAKRTTRSLLIFALRVKPKRRSRSLFIEQPEP